MKERLKEIIIEEKSENLDDMIPRELKLAALPRKATVLTGIRRSGKSTYLRKHIRQRNIPYFYINFSDERISTLRSENLGLCIEAFFELEPNAVGSLVCIGLDEIQIIDGWELFVDRLLRNKLYEVYVTGSSAKLLSKEIGTQMRGRSIQYEFFPLSFTEFIAPLKNPKRSLTGPEKGKFTGLLNKYLIHGGFPEVRTIDDNLRFRILQEYYSTIIYKDIIDRNNPKNPHAVSQCLKILINQVGSLYSATKIANKCKSLGYKISKGDVSEYIEWFQDCYLIYSVPIYTENINRQMTNPKKLYCIDNGFVRANQAGVSANTGHLLENLVFNVLRRSSDKVYYYKERGEVDFITIQQNKAPLLIQVCEDMTNIETRNREIESLINAMDDLKLKTGWIITLNESSEELIDGLRIKVIPLLTFLLTSSEMND